jgi:hypothetical protein
MYLAACTVYISTLEVFRDHVKKKLLTVSVSMCIIGDALEELTCVLNG